jgi:hypothetical protein
MCPRHTGAGGGRRILRGVGIATGSHRHDMLWGGCSQDTYSGGGRGLGSFDRYIAGGVMGIPGYTVGRVSTGYTGGGGGLAGYNTDLASFRTYTV